MKDMARRNTDACVRKKLLRPMAIALSLESHTHAELRVLMRRAGSGCWEEPLPRTSVDGANCVLPDGGGSTRRRRGAPVEGGDASLATGGAPDGEEEPASYDSFSLISGNL